MNIIFISLFCCSLVEFGLDVSGRAKFEAGFVRSIESVSSHGEIGGISATKVSVLWQFHWLREHEKQWQQSTNPSNNFLQSFVNVTLQLHGVSVVYDVHYSLKEFNGHGTIEFHLPVLAFHLELSRNHDSMEKTGSMNFLFTAGDADITTRFHPDNGYTQLWAREMRNNAPFRTGLVKAFGDWRNSWQELLQDAVNSVPFPDTCYDCP